MTEHPGLPAAALPALPPDTVFGPPPLVEGEDAGAYADLLARVSAMVKPADILEHIWVRDVVDLVWEALRLRRLKASLLQANLRRGISEALGPIIGGNKALELAGRFVVRETAATDRVAKLLASAGLTMDAVVAQTLAAKLDPFERIDRLITSAELRRGVALREVERHRASLGCSLRQAAEKVEDAEFEVIDAPGGSAA